jgi:proline dehydrogenase
MLRQTLLYFSEHDDLKSVLFKLPYARRMAARFVAGDTVDEALAVAKQLNDRSFRVTLDLLGESVLDSLGEIDAHGAETTISLKLTQLGLDIDTDFCYRNLLTIVRRAEDLGNFVRIDMESSEYTGATLDMFYRVFAEHRNVGIVIQSYLYRSEDDVSRLVQLGASVRLCKGAYSEPISVAFQARGEVDANYVRLMKMLLDGGVPTAIASHDERMIDETLAHATRTGISEDAFEIQMLYGVRREYQKQLVDNGLNMRIYLPYGSQWYSYFMRRMAERPANLLFVVRAALGD